MLYNDCNIYRKYFGLNISLLSTLPDTLPSIQSGLTLSALLNRCGLAIKSAIPDLVWVKIEVSQIKSHGGHLYITAIERSPETGRELAKTSAMVWSAQVPKLISKFKAATNMELAAGIQILVLINPVFSAQYGLSLHISDIDPNYTLGDLEARLKKIRTTLLENKEANLNLNLDTPSDFFRVGVISPSGAAGLEDFQVEADRLSKANLCHFIYFQAIFQGDKTKESIKQAFTNANSEHERLPFDAVVVIRGGGATADLHWLNELLLARLVCRFKCPVFTGIGHERDKSILDEYSNRAFGTPSKVIAFIKEVITKKALKGDEDWNAICKAIESKLNTASLRVNLRHTEIEAGIVKLLDRAQLNTEKVYGLIKSNSVTVIEDAALKSDRHHQVILTGSISILDKALNNINRDFSSISERSKAILTTASLKVENNFNSIIGDVATIATQVDSTAYRHMNDIRFFAKKKLDDANKGTNELMSGILAHGVAPTLNRGFAMVQSGSGPISSKAAAEACNDLELVFRDGNMKITKG